MTPEVFDLLPTRGIDQSLLFAVLLGLWIVFAFNELYGWVFTGLVVPGYLAAVIIVQPESGVAIVIEAVLTYLLARGLSDTLTRLGAWHRFFGRERFYLILVLSVFVRQQAELWLLPVVGGELLGMPLDDQQTFFGVGLVLVPLLANMFWTLNLDRGLLQVGIPVALTWALLAWVFLPLTNYDLSTIATSYENVAASFLAGPKVYIVMLCAAGLAAVANHRYGWEFGGILVPGLLAVAWFTPVKLLTTVSEAIVLYLVVSALLAIPRLSSLNAEGSRRIVLVFTLAFFLKLAIGWGIGDRWPGLQVTDLFGFGYLMPSLIAAKMLGRHALGRVLLPTLTLSAAGFLAGNVVAGGIHWAAAPPILPPPQAREAAPPLGAHATGLAAFAQLQAVGRWDRAPAEARLRVARALDAQAPAFADWIVGGGQPPGLAIALRPTTDGAFALVDPTGTVGAPVGWLRPGRSGPLLRVPNPGTDPAAVAAAPALCRATDCRGVLWAARDGAPPTPLLSAIPPSAVIELASAPDGLAAPPSPLSGPLRLRPEALWALAGLPAARPAVDAESWIAVQVDPAHRLRARQRLEPMERALLRQLTTDLLAATGAPSPGHLAWLEARAALVDHHLQPLDGCLRAPCLGLGGGPGAREAITLLARPAQGALLIEAPSPAVERGTWRFAFATWLADEGRALLIATPRPIDSIEPRLPRPTRAGSAFHAVHSALVDALAAPDGLVVQIRGRAAHRPGRFAALVALEQPVLAASQRPAALDRILARSPLADLAPVELDAGSAEHVDLVFATNAQRRLAIERGGLRFVRIWLSEAARAPWFESAAPRVPAGLAEAIGPVSERRAVDHLASGGDAPPPPGFVAVIEALDRYSRSHNPLALQTAVELASGEPTIRLGVARHPGEGRGYVWASGGPAGPRAVFFGDGPAWRGRAAPEHVRGLGSAVVGR